MMMMRRASVVLTLAAVVLLGRGDRQARADVKLPALFTDHMVLQQGQGDRVWGWADPDEEVSVSINGQTKSAKAGQDGKWLVTLDPLTAGGPYTMTVKGKNTITLDDVLVGEVWVCSGQSNMQWSVSNSTNAELEIKTAKYPKIRLITVPSVGTQEPKDNFNGRWQLCTPDTIPGFSAVGYFFGRQLYETLDVPIGLINDAWGGSACEAWVRRDILAADEKFKPLLENWEAIEQRYPKEKEEYEEKMVAWKEAAKKAKEENKPAPPQPNNP